MMRKTRRHGPARSAAHRWWLRLGAAAVVLSVTAAVVGAARGSGGPARAATVPAVSAIQVGAAHGASYVPALRGKRPLFILVLGSDERKGLGGKRADSIHIVGIDVRHRRASILGIPRDSWVSIPGHGNEKITSALEFGGPSLMVRTVESVTGIRMDFWVLTTFEGFKTMVNRIGGLKVQVPWSMHDRYSGSNFEPGLRKMNGKQALSFSRDRHSVPGGDFGRTSNQGRVLVAALTKLGKEFGKDPAALFDWIGLFWKETDSDLPVTTLLDLGLTAAQMAPAHVNNVVMPGFVGNVGAASVVFISSAARPLFADMKKDGVIGARGR